MKLSGLIKFGALKTKPKILLGICSPLVLLMALGARVRVPGSRPRPPPHPARDGRGQGYPLSTLWQRCSANGTESVVEALLETKCLSGSRAPYIEN